MHPFKIYVVRMPHLLLFMMILRPLTAVLLYSMFVFMTNYSVINWEGSHYFSYLTLTKVSRWNISHANLSTTAWNTSLQLNNLSQLYYSVSIGNISTVAWNASSQISYLSQPYWHISLSSVSNVALNASTQLHYLSQSYFWKCKFCCFECIVTMK